MQDICKWIALVDNAIFSVKHSGTPPTQPDDDDDPPAMIHCPEASMIIITVVYYLLSTVQSLPLPIGVLRAR